MTEGKLRRQRQNYQQMLFERSVNFPFHSAQCSCGCTPHGGEPLMRCEEQGHYQCGKCLKLSRRRVGPTKELKYLCSLCPPNSRLQTFRRHDQLKRVLDQKRSPGLNSGNGCAYLKPTDLPHLNDGEKSRVRHQECGSLPIACPGCNWHGRQDKLKRHMATSMCNWVRIMIMQNIKFVLKSLYLIDSRSRFRSPRVYE